MAQSQNKLLYLYWVRGVGCTARTPINTRSMARRTRGVKQQQQGVLVTIDHTFSGASASSANLSSATAVFSSCLASFPWLLSLSASSHTLRFSYSASFQNKGERAHQKEKKRQQGKAAATAEATNGKQKRSECRKQTEQPCTNRERVAKASRKTTTYSQ